MVIYVGTMFHAVNPFMKLTIVVGGEGGGGEGGS